MGWLFSQRSRSELIRDLTTAGQSEAACYETIAHTLRGNVLWSVRRLTARQPGVLGLDAGQSTTLITCCLLQGSGSNWGYKCLDESAHPYYYSCPLRYLDMAPVQCTEWREQVRHLHASRTRLHTSRCA